MLKYNQLFAKFRKFEFRLRSMTFLGHIISSEGVEVDPRKTEMVKNWPRPLTSTDIRSFLGLAVHYRRFMDGFTSIAVNFTTLTLKSVKFEWSESYERSFQVLKDTLTSTPLMTLPEGTKGFVVYCDTSRLGLDCILMKHGKVVTHAFRQLMVHVKNYPNHDLELVAVVFSLKIWRHYLHGLHVDVFTNHKSLYYVLTQKEMNL